MRQYNIDEIISMVNDHSHPLWNEVIEAMANDLPDVMPVPDTIPDRRPGPDYWSRIKETGRQPYDL